MLFEKEKLKKSNEGREIILRVEQERKQLCSLSLGDIKQVKTRTLCPKKKIDLMLEVCSYLLINKMIKK